MTKRHLRIFAEVCEQKSMTRASERLYMTQPAVSQAVRELEEHYGTQLFERFARKLYITDAGRELYRYARDILNLFDDVEERLGEEETIGLRLGANLTVGTVLVSRYIDAYRARHPGAWIKVRVSGSKRLLGLLGENEIDFALLEDMVLPQEFMCVPFYRDKLVIVSSPKDPKAGQTLSFEALKGCDFLLRETGAGVRDRFDYLMLLRNIHIDPLWESSSPIALVEAAHAGYGITIQPYLLVKGYLDSGYLAEIQVTDLPLERSLNIVWYRNKILSEAAREFIELIKGQKIFAPEAAVTGEKSSRLQ